MNRFMKKIVTGVLALTMVMGTVLSVSAAVVPPTPASLQKNPATATIQKVLQVPTGVAKPTAETFVFNFTPVGVMGADGEVIASGAPGYVAPAAMPQMDGDNILQITSASLTQDGAEGGFDLYKGNADALDDVDGDWPHAGVYKYTVAENAAAATANMQYSVATYEMYVYVENTSAMDGTLVVTNVGFRISNPEVAGMVQPTVTPLPTITPFPGSGTVSTFPKDNPIFTNRFTPPVDLEIDKKVEGEYADTTKKFEYTLVVNRPQAAADLTAGDASSLVCVGTVYEANGDVAYTVTVTFAQGATLGTVTTSDPTIPTGTFLLSHGQKLDFLDTPSTATANRTGLPAGSTYTLTESAAAGYTPKADAVVNGAAGLGSGSAGQKGQALTIGAGATSGVPAPLNAAIILGDRDNKVSWTNEYQVVTPTGILLNNLPFILLILVAVGGFVGYIASKRRKASN